MKININNQIKEYIEKNIFPKYNNYYAHGMDHINNVIKQSLIIAKYFDVDLNMVYVVACYHDLGLVNGRENHESESGKILYNDSNLRKFFTEEQIIIMKEAVEDHRGSRKIPPRNIYGKIVSDADRDTDIYILAKRQLPTSIKNHPTMKEFDEHFERCHSYIMDRRRENFQFNLWTENKTMRKNIDKFAKDFCNKEFARLVYKKEWDYIQENNLEEKIFGCCD
jgi:uncharacterized protein